MNLYSVHCGVVYRTERENENSSSNQKEFLTFFLPPRGSSSEQSGEPTPAMKALGLPALGAPLSSNLSTPIQRPVLSFASVPEGRPSQLWRRWASPPHAFHARGTGEGLQHQWWDFPGPLTLSPRASLSCEVSGKRLGIFKMHFTEDVGQGKINP